ncbi:MAG: hypothetical protein WBE72_22500 [Terracidiphilus sp.]
MHSNRQQRIRLLIAAVAILAALALLLVPHVNPGNAAAWLAVLPILFVGLISPLSLLSPMAYMYLGRAPDAPALPATFQRPPPVRLG